MSRERHGVVRTGDAELRKTQAKGQQKPVKMPG
ncbi:hypothetical protein PBR20603_02731 [Pandoraea bronchicola]|uniref:Uncharacterized protein n=1 Tax=Pandoraea bronchicola TaxID=2508287 RepID=A0A5E5BUE2_9BURK|nr:hypothetical protein PBR20603_02731 [Pandoraea bronchicola]